MEKDTAANTQSATGAACDVRPLTVVEGINEAIEMHTREMARLFELRETAKRLGVAHMRQSLMANFVWPSSPF